jgi:hypothetical protein
MLEIPLQYCNFHYDIGNSVTMLEIPLQYCYFRYNIIISITILDNSITMLETLYSMIDKDYKIYSKLWRNQNEFQN